MFSCNFFPFNFIWIRFFKSYMKNSHDIWPRLLQDLKAHERNILLCLIWTMKTRSNVIWDASVRLPPTTLCISFLRCLICVLQRRHGIGVSDFIWPQCISAILFHIHIQRATLFIDGRWDCLLGWSAAKWRSHSLDKRPRYDEWKAAGSSGHHSGSSSLCCSNYSVSFFFFISEKNDCSCIWCLQYDIEPVFSRHGCTTAATIALSFVLMSCVRWEGCGGSSLSWRD